MKKNARLRYGGSTGGCDVVSKTQQLLSFSSDFSYASFSHVMRDSDNMAKTLNF